MYKGHLVRNIECLRNILRNNLSKNLPRLSANYWFIAFSKTANFSFMLKYQINIVITSYEITSLQS